MSTPEEQGTTTTDAPAPVATWRRLASRAAWFIPLLFVLLMIAFQFVDPFLLINCVVFGLLGWWAGRGGKASLIVLGILSVVFIAMNVPFIIPSLMAPASFIDFLITSFLLLAAVTAAVSSFVALRAGDGVTSGPRTMFRVVVALGVVAIVVAAVGRLTYDGGALQEGDVELTTVDTEFDPEELSADSGQVAVFITNDDPTLHTFTIDELDVNVSIPQNSTARVVFDAEAGEYEFVCLPHEQGGMTGTLTVQ